MTVRLSDEHLAADLAYYESTDVDGLLHAERERIVAALRELQEAPT